MPKNKLDPFFNTTLPAEMWHKQPTKRINFSRTVRLVPVLSNNQSRMPSITR